MKLKYNDIVIVKLVKAKPYSQICTFDDTIMYDRMRFIADRPDKNVMVFESVDLFRHYIELSHEKVEKDVFTLTAAIYDAKTTIKICEQKLDEYYSLLKMKDLPKIDTVTRLLSLCQEKSNIYKKLETGTELPSSYEKYLHNLDKGICRLSKKVHGFTEAHPEIPLEKIVEAGPQIDSLQFQIQYLTEAEKMLEEHFCRSNI